MSVSRATKGSIPASGAHANRRAVPTPPPHKPFLFLSHAGADSAAAVRLAQRLERTQEAKDHGLVVWIDKKDLAAGEGWKQQLEAALQQSTAFAVYIGSNGVMNWVRDEVNVALDRAHKDIRYPIIPVISKHGDIAALPGWSGRRCAWSLAPKSTWRCARFRVWEPLRPTARTSSEGATRRPASSSSCCRASTS
jgi:TIR domain-containing protein